MITYETKNLITVTEGIIIHGCNAQGAMGSGVAGALRRQWPEIYKSYSKMVAMRKTDCLGMVDTVWIPEHPRLVVMNAITQEYFGSDGNRYADLNAIDKTMRYACNFAGGYLPVYTPKIGCGLGGCKWEEEVKPLFERISEDLPHQEIIVCDI